MSSRTEISTTGFARFLGCVRKILHFPQVAKEQSQSLNKRGRGEREGYRIEQHITRPHCLGMQMQTILLNRVRAHLLSSSLKLQEFALKAFLQLGQYLLWEITQHPADKANSFKNLLWLSCPRGLTVMG